MHPVQILIIDLGSQYTLVIARALRELGYRTAVLSSGKAEAWLRHNNPRAIILSGGDDSVTRSGARQPPKGLIKNGAPILGICYGMQWIAHALGGALSESRDRKEYGEATIGITRDDPLFHGLDRVQTVWASHGDSVDRVPPDFQITALSENKTIAAMWSPEMHVWGVQFHPEVVETPSGKQMLSNFVQDICRCDQDWEPENMIEAIQHEVVRTTQGNRAIIGFSGGVDSSTLSAILSPALGRQLLAVCIDHGGLRDGEVDEIKANAKAAGVRPKIVRTAVRFRRAVGLSTHSEVKRKRFSRLYMRVLEEEAVAFGAKFIIQGSLATDFIESGSHGDAALIKTHHNAYAKSRLYDLHPLNQLFKYEIRELARALGLASSITERHPFPGPGLYLRVNGAPATAQRIAIVRWADKIVRDIVRSRDLNSRMSQLVVSMNCTRRVGIKGDRRVYGYSIEYRGVRTADFMTADGFEWSKSTRRAIMSAVTKHPMIITALPNEADKPPCTTEPE